jgi:epoxyqueuosine reductase
LPGGHCSARHFYFLMNESLSTRIKEIGRELGFAGVGIARAEFLPVEYGRLVEWLQRGYHASMAWMERETEKRADPTLLFDGAKSVIVALENYYTPHEHAPDPSAGKVSRYAWGDDYHVVVKKRLERFLELIREELPSVNGKVCIDTAPFMDKAWAARAGLGWIGKHSNLITRDAGSWFFIGSIIVDVELEYDEPFADEHCGTCRACIDACPPQAIVEPYVVDSARCISYATIEHRGDTLPIEQENLDGWVYGCDVCQDVCPWNRFEQPTTEMRFEPRNNETSLDLIALSNMPHEEYVERFRGSAIKRAKLGGLQRNAKHLLGSSEDELIEETDR